MKQRGMLILSALVVFTLANLVRAEDCGKAKDLAVQAFQAGRQGKPAAEQRRLLQEALRLCPDYAEAHNNVGVLLEDDGRYEDALRHYQEAARLKPPMPEAWFGIGEVYRKTERHALALEAYLHACNDDDARLHIEEILASNRYRTAEEGEVLEQKSLELLFDADRREAMNRKLAACGFDTILNRDGVRVRASMEPEFILRNILFATQSAEVTEGFEQLRAVAAALRQFPERSVFIGGHTDKRWRSANTEAEKRRRNQQLSERRARSVAEYLEEQGISRNRMKIRGYGLERPEIDEDSEEAYRRNRRVTVRVE